MNDRADRTPASPQYPCPLAAHLGRELLRRLAPNALGSMTSVLRSTRYPDRS